MLDQSGACTTGVGLSPPLFCPPGTVKVPGGACQPCFRGYAPGGPNNTMCVRVSTVTTPTNPPPPPPPPPRCPPSQINLAGQCCPSYTVPQGTSCVSPPPPPPTTCQSRGGALYCATQQNGVCPSGTISYNGGTCLATGATCPTDIQLCCSGNTLPNFVTGQCCPPNTIPQGGSCAPPPPRCPAGETPAPNGQCCPAGTRPQGDSCGPPPPSPTNCGSGEELVGGRCQCLPGEVPNPKGG